MKIEATEPRLYLSATATPDFDPGELVESEDDELEFVWFDAWWFEAEYESDEWSDEWNDSEFDFADSYDFAADAESDWLISDGWYEFDTVTYGDDWIDESAGDDFWFEFETIVWDWTDATDAWLDDSFEWDDAWWYEDTVWAGDTIVTSFGDDALIPDDDQQRPFGDDALIPDEDQGRPFGNDALIPVDDFVYYDDFGVDIYETDFFETVDFDFATEFDTHSTDEGVVFEFEDGFTCELFFEDDTAVAGILTTDDFVIDDGFVFETGVFESTFDEFASDDFFAEEFVFVDEFVFVETSEFEDEVFVDDFTNLGWNDVFVDASFSEDVDQEFYDDSFTYVSVETDFEVEVTTQTDTIVVDVVVLDETLSDPVSGDFLAEFEVIVSEAIADVHNSNADFIDFSTGLEDGADASDGGLVSEILDVVVEIDSDSINGKDVPVVSSVTVVSELVESSAGKDELGDFDGVSDSVGTSGTGEVTGDFVTSPQFVLAGLTEDAGSVESGAQATDDAISDTTVTVNGGSGSVIAAGFVQSEPGSDDGSLADALPGSSPVVARAANGRALAGRQVARDVLARKLQVKGSAKHAAATRGKTQQAGTVRNRTIPVTEQSSTQTPSVAGQESRATAARRQTARARFDFRMSRAAAQASRLTTQAQSGSQSISYDATLLAFEHPALSMQLDGLSQPATGDAADGTFSQHDHQPGYAQMVSAAGTLAIGGAAGIHFTQRRGWSMLLRFVRALVGRV